MDFIELAVQDLKENFSSKDRGDLLVFMEAETLEDLAEKIMKEYGKKYGRAEMPAATFEEYTDNILSKLDSVKEKIAQIGCISVEELKENLGFKFFGHGGITGAKLYSATIAGIKVLLKRTTAVLDGDVGKGVVYECLVYRYFFNYLLTNKITPNIPYYYGITVCKTQFLGDVIAELFSEHMQGDTLHKYLIEKKKNKETVPPEFWKTVLFQILYTLVCFQQLNIHHNDLHTSNIFLNLNMKGVIRYYVNNTDYFTIDLSNAGLVKIFDMDTAGVDCYAPQKKGTEYLFLSFRKQLETIFAKYTDYFAQGGCSNLKLASEFYKKLGLKNRGKNQFDLFIIFCTILLYENLLDDETQKFIYRVFDKQDIEDSINTKSLNYSGHTCRSKKISDQEKLYEPLLNDPYFSSLKNVDIPTSNIYHLIER